MASSRSDHEEQQRLEVAWALALRLQRRSVEIEPGSRSKWAARVAVELHRHEAKGSLRELVAFALELWATEGHNPPEMVGIRYANADSLRK